MFAVALAALLAAAEPARATCDRPLEVTVAPATPPEGEQIARGVRRVAAWSLASEEPALGALTRLNHRQGWGRTADGRWLDWEVAGSQPGAFRQACGPLDGPWVAAPPSPPEAPRIRGYRYVGSRPLVGSAFAAVGLWHAVEGPPESLVAVFDPSARTVRAPYVVLVRTPLRLAAVSAASERGDLFISIAAITQAVDNEPVSLLEWSWRDGKTHGVPLD